MRLTRAGFVLVLVLLAVLPLRVAQGVSVFPSYRVSEAMPLGFEPERLAGGVLYGNAPNNIEGGIGGAIAFAGTRIEPFLVLDFESVFTGASPDGTIGCGVVLPVYNDDFYPFFTEYGSPRVVASDGSRILIPIAANDQAVITGLAYATDGTSNLWVFRSWHGAWPEIVRVDETGYPFAVLGDGTVLMNRHKTGEVPGEICAWPPYSGEVTVLATNADGTCATPGGEVIGGLARSFRRPLQLFLSTFPQPQTITFGPGVIDGINSRYALVNNNGQRGSSLRALRTRSQPAVRLETLVRGWPAGRRIGGFQLDIHDNILAFVGGRSYRPDIRLLIRD